MANYYDVTDMSEEVSKKADEILKRIDNIEKNTNGRLDKIERLIALSSIPSSYVDVLYDIEEHVKKCSDFDELIIEDAVDVHYESDYLLVKCSCSTKAEWCFIKEVFTNNSGMSLFKNEIKNINKRYKKVEKKEYNNPINDLEV